MNDRKKRITFAIPSLGSGGAERVISILSQELALRGHDVTVIMIANEHLNYSLSDQIRLVKLNCEMRYGRMNVGKRYAYRIRDLRSAIVENHPDILISFMSETNIDVCLAMLGLDIPVIVSERNDPSIDPASRAKQLLRRVLYRRANGFVFQTPDAQAYFSKQIQDRSRIILNPLTAQLPQPHTGLREKRIVAVGRLNKQKNYPLLLDAFADFSRQYPDYLLEIYGDGPQEQLIRKLLAEKGLEQRVILSGFCRDVHDRIRSAAFFVMTSDFEGMPNALVEAMALGLPCISTDCRCGGPRMLIENGENGILIPTGDQQSLVQAMIRLAQDPDKAHMLGQNARNITNRVATPIIVEQWLAYIDATLRQRERK